MSALARIVAILLLVAAGANAEGMAAGAAPPATEAPLFTDDDLLLFEVTTNNQELTDGLGAYSSRAGLYLPLGEFARLLDLAIMVDPPAERAEGWLLSEDRRFILDLKTRHAKAGTNEIDFSSTDAVLFHDDIFIRADLIQRLLPLTLKINKSDLSLEVVTRERFPFEDRLAREGRRNGLRLGSSADETVLKVPVSYDLFTPPSVDFSIQANINNHAPERTASWEARLGGDLAYAGLQVFAGSDPDGRLSNARALLERKDPDGVLAGPFGATRSDSGDVYTPSLALGVASASGRGLMVTSRPLDQASVFSTTDIRGELPLGYEVELYVNEVLRGSQAEAVRGNYEFLSVPLAYGLNVVRLVFYGPRGEHREEVRRLNVGSGQLKAGHAEYSFGMVQQDTPLFEIDQGGSLGAGTFGQGSTRVVGSLSYGLTNGLTLTSGLAQYTPNTTYDHRTRRLTSGGILTSIGGMAVAADIGEDDRGGTAETAALGTRLLGVSMLARHAEYSGGFVDETQFRDISATAPLKRSSNLTADWAFDVPLTGLAVSMSAHAQHSQFVDGSSRWLQEARISTVVNRYLVSAGWQNEVTDLASGIKTRTSSGTLDASTFVWRKWQVRASATYDAAPEVQLDTLSLVADGSIGANTTVRFGISHAFSHDSSVSGSTTLDTSATWHMPTHDMTATATFTPERHEFRIGVQFALGTIYDPVRDHYIPVRPGAAAGGNAVIETFLDKNGDGYRQADESAIGGITATAGNWSARSDDKGEMVASGLGDGARARVRIDPESIADPYLNAPATIIELVPHPGRVSVIPYPLAPTGEVALETKLQGVDGTERGISALRVQLVTAGGEVIAEGRSEYDGTLILERLPPGEYSLRIAPDQADRLSLGLAEPVLVTIPANGGFAGQFSARILVKH